jgi:predicted DNA-binding transcriptional regulator AlpA
MRQRVREILAEKLELRVPESAQMLTTFEVAHFLRVSRWTLSDWRRNGTGPPFVKLSRRVLRYPRYAFERWMYRHLQSKSPEK